MEESENYISESSERSSQILSTLPTDILNKLLFESDWKTVANYCKTSKRVAALCRNLWESRAINEFGKKYWIEIYKQPLRNYLAARVRFLMDEHNRLISLTFGKLPTKKITSFSFMDIIDPKFPKNMSAVHRTFDNYGGFQIIRSINDYESQKGNKRPFTWPRGQKLTKKEVINYIKEYYVNVIETRKQAIDIRNEIFEIGKSLAMYLHSTSKETNSFKFINTTASLPLYDENEEGFEITLNRIGLENKVLPFELIHFRTDVFLFISESGRFKSQGDFEDKKIGYKFAEEVNKNVKDILLEFGVPSFCINYLYPYKETEYLQYVEFNDIVEEELT